MISLKQVHTEDFNRIYPLFAGFNNPRLSNKDWFRIFQDNWQTNTGYIGYMLLDDDNVVGFFGLIFSKPIIGGQVHNLCNFGNWIVKKNYRSNSISMLLPLLRLTDYTITNVSANSTVRQIFKKMGFKEIYRKWRIVFPLPSLSSVKTAKCNFYENDAIAERISGEAHRIYLDHTILNKCFHLLFTDQYQSCYILITKAVLKHVRFARVHYISNPDNFYEFRGKIIRYICKRMGVVSVIIDERLFNKDQIPFSLVWRPPPILYKSSTLVDGQIGTIYTEEVVLGS